MYFIMYMLGCSIISALSVLYLDIQINDLNGIPLPDLESMMVLSILIIPLVLLAGLLILNMYFYIEDSIQEYKQFAEKEGKK